MGGNFAPIALRLVNKQSLIYMIGCGYINNNKWIFNSYIADRLDKSSEEIIIKKWLKDMEIKFQSWFATVLVL